VELPDNTNNILLVSLGGVGDTVMFSPVITAVKNRYPTATVDLLVSNHLSRSCYIGTKGIHHVAVVNTNHKFFYLKIVAFIRYALSVRLFKHYDLAVYEASLHPLWSIIVRVVGGVKINILHPTVADGLAPNVAIARLFDESIDKNNAFLTVTQEARDEAAIECKRHGINLTDPGLDLLAIYPSAQLAHRPRWSLQRMLEVVKRLRLEGFTGKVVVIGSVDDGLDWIAANSEDYIDANLAGRLSLLASAAILEICRLMIGNDGGMMHVAGAVGCPLVAITPNAPSSFCPPGKHTVMVQSLIPCAPCYPSIPEDCPNFRCCDEITVDRVYAACVKLLSETTFRTLSLYDFSRQSVQSRNENE